GLDDKEILLWHLPRAGYEIGAALPADAERLFADWAPVRGVLVQRATGKHVAVFIGADHHGAHPDVPRLRDLLAELDPQSAFRVSRLDEFFQAAADGAKPSPLAGELRWSYRYAWTLQGVHGTRAPLKRRYSAAELALARVAEPLAALARRAGGRDRRPVLELAWRALVRCQFHDAIAGCEGDDVAHAVESRLTSVEALAHEVVRGSLHDLVHHDPDAARGRAASPTLVVWNPAARPRRGVMIADVTLFRRDVLVGPRGDRVPREGQGYRPFALAPWDGRTVPVQVLDRRTGDRLARTTGPIKVRRLAAGPLVAALEARFDIGRRVGIRLVAILYADSPMVRCILDIDNQAAWHRVRARLPVGLHGAAAVAGTAFGSVARPPVTVDPADYPLET